MGQHPHQLDETRSEAPVPTAQLLMWWQQLALYDCSLQSAGTTTRQQGVAAISDALAQKLSTLFQDPAGPSQQDDSGKQGYFDKLATKTGDSLKTKCTSANCCPVSSRQSTSLVTAAVYSPQQVPWDNDQCFPEHW